jgi:hypothetical protein
MNLYLDFLFFVYITILVVIQIHLQAFIFFINLIVKIIFNYHKVYTFHQVQQIFNLIK